MKTFLIYAKYILSLMALGFVLDLIFFGYETELFQYIGTFIGSVIATAIVYKDKKQNS